MTIKELLNNQYSFKNSELFLGLPEEACVILNRNIETYSIKTGEFIFK